MANAPRSRPSRWLRTVLGAGLGALALTLAAVIGLVVLIWPRVDVWRPMLVAQIERQIGLPVRIMALHPAWEGWHPALRIEGVRIEGRDGRPVLEVASADARISWRGLLQATPRFALLRLDSPRLVVERLAAGRYAVAGIEWTGTAPGDGRAVDWLLSQGRVDIHGARLDVRDALGELAPLTVSGVELTIAATGWRHALALRLDRIGEAVGKVSMTAQIDRPAFAPPSQWRRWSGQVDATVQDLELAPALAMASAFGLPAPAQLIAAQGGMSIEAGARFGPARLDSAHLSTRTERLRVDLKEGRLGFASLEGRIGLERLAEGGHRLRLSRLAAVDAAGFGLSTEGDVELHFDAAHTLTGAWARLKSFDAASAWLAVRRLPLPVAVRERFRGIEMGGTVQDLTLRWIHPDAPETAGRSADRADDLLRSRPGQPRFELSASFDKLSLRGPQGGERPLPGVARLSGSVRASENEGRLTLASSDPVLTFPGVFEDPVLRFARLDADLEWTRHPDDPGAPLHLVLHQLSLRSPDASGTAQGRWQGGAGGPGVVDGSARLEAVDVRRVARYLPLALPASVRHWVGQSLRAGRGDAVRFVLRGDLRSFPFRDPAQGEFRITAALRDLTLAYAPTWPALERLRGEARFDGLGMSVRVNQGETQGLRLSEGQAQIADWRDGLLAVETRAAGRAMDALRFVAESPVAAMVAPITRELSVEGETRGTVRLRWPLREASALPRVSGTVDLFDALARLGAQEPSLTQASGRIDFTERGAVVSDLRGLLLGGPVRIDARLTSDAPGRIEASGVLDVEALHPLLTGLGTQWVSGRLGYRLGADLGPQGLALRLDSDMQGVQIDLPEPLNKSAQASWPLRIGFVQTADGDRLEVRLKEEGVARVDRERDPASGQLRIRSAGLGWNIDPELSEPGVSLRAALPTLDLDAWRALAEGTGPLVTHEGSPPTALPDRVALVTDTLTLAGRTLHDVVLGATRSAGRWAANVAAREIAGHFEWQDARPGERIGTLSAHFARLVLPRAQEAEVEAALSAPPERLPGLDVVADEVILGNRSWGRLELGATNGGSLERPVWTLDRLTLTHPAARLQASGIWALAPGGGAERSTSLDFQLDVSDAGALLDGFGFPGAVHAGSGGLEGRLHWHGSPIGFDYPSLTGEVRLDLQRGEFLKVDPGAAKLIGVLNMQSLPKRLSGDFRDLFGDGFAFDTLRGRVSIDEGQARTEGLLIRGLQAQVAIRGDADLARETQRLTIEVVPQINAGLASIAVGAMVNPLLGLSSFAAQYLFKSPLQQALAFEIDVSGSWTDPAVSEARRKPVVAPPPSAEPRP